MNEAVIIEVCESGLWRARDEKIRIVRYAAPTKRASIASKGLEEMI